MKRIGDENAIKFLKEAILMKFFLKLYLLKTFIFSNFDHPNIIKLLGVQRDIDPHFLVIELMEGGDLCSFLKES